MKYKKLFALLLLVSSAILLLNAASPGGFFPSGHGTGRFSEVVIGAVFGFAGVILLLSRRPSESEK